MQIGNYYKDILCESVYDKKSAKVRIQTLPGQVIPEGVFVESGKHSGQITHSEQSLQQKM